jgi:predicted amidohydrolase
MQELLKIACLQVDVQWENPNENLKCYAESITKTASDVNLVILPEMFSTGFSMKPENCAETMEGISVSWMKEIAFKRNAAIMGSLVIVENNNYYNRLIFVHPNGELQYYNKRHLFTLAGEDKIYTSGNKR